jgi:uncharacterized membrane protein
MSTPVQVVIAAFQSEDGAAAALKELKTARREGLIKIDNAAVLTKDADGRLHIRDAMDMGGGKGAVVGGVLGAVVGLLAGPVGLVALGGAALGGLAAKLADGGFNDSRLKQLGAGLQPSSSCLVAVVQHTWVDEVHAAMVQAGGDTIIEQISADMAEQLAAGSEVTYTTVSSDGGVSSSRVVTPGPLGPGEAPPDEPAGPAA